MRLPLAMDDLVQGVEHEVASGTALDHLQAAMDLADQANALADSLVGHFVEAARSEGWSWAQIGSVLGVSKQAAQQRFVTPPIPGPRPGPGPARRSERRRGRRGFLSRFTTAAREVITASQEEARRLGHDEVGTGHFVLTLLHDAEAPSVRALRALAVDVETVRARVLEVIGGVEGASITAPPLAPQTKKALELALQEGLRSPEKKVAPEHILLGVLAEGEDVGARVLTDLGATLDSVRHALRQTA